MLKIAARILDIFDETISDVISKLAVNIPEFVKDAVIPNEEELSLISDYDFAIVYYNLKSEKMRKYLLVDPGNIWLSAKYFLESRDVWPKIAQGIIVRSILSRAEKHGIDSYPIFSALKEIKTSLMSEGIWKKLPEQNIYNEKLFKIDKDKEEALRSQAIRSGGPAKPPSEKLSRVYALYPGDDTWITKPMYDITTPDLVKKACEYFDTYKGVMPLKTKRKFARALLKRSKDLNIDVNSDIRLYGSTNINYKLAEENLIRRAKLCKDEHKKLAVDILSLSNKMSGDDLIYCIEAFDKIAFDNNISRFNLPDPILSVSDEEKDKKVLYESESKKFTLKDLKNVIKNKSYKLEEIFNNKIVSSLKSNPEKAFDALPKPYKKIIANIA